ncbi:hypothetical protein C1891_17625 [Pseudomonas sp. GW456-12-1-14-TSB6]|nr:hypothetical protein C1891_17625 [Pseudomonas sp. GW456-12-1-14-TSB6]
MAFCESEPARDEAFSLDINVDCQIAIASRLAPTVDFCLVSRVASAADSAADAYAAVDTAGPCHRPPSGRSPRTLA